MLPAAVQLFAKEVVVDVAVKYVAPTISFFGASEVPPIPQPLKVT
jgi:hypothetical protein